jgi:hypothetical protein
LRSKSQTEQSKALGCIDRVLSNKRDYDLVDDKARKCIWSNALYFTKENKSVEIKTISIQIAARVYDYLEDKEEKIKEASEIAKHLSYLVLKDSEEKVRIEAFRRVPVTENTKELIINRVRDISKDIRQIAYEKIIEARITLNTIKEEERFD